MYILTEAKALLVEKELAEKAKQSYGKMEAAMKEMTASCVPEASVAVVYQESALANRVNTLEGTAIASKEQLSQTEVYTSNISKAQTEVKQVYASQELTNKNQELTATAQFADPKVNFRDTCSKQPRSSWN